MRNRSSSKFVTVISAVLSLCLLGFVYFLLDVSSPSSKIEAATPGASPSHSPSPGPQPIINPTPKPKPTPKPTPKPVPVKPCPNDDDYSCNQGNGYQDTITGGSTPPALSSLVNKYRDFCKKECAKIINVDHDASPAVMPNWATVYNPQTGGYDSRITINCCCQPMPKPRPSSHGSPSGSPY